MAVEACRSCDEVRHIERHEPPPVETPGIPLRQHEGLGDIPLLINMAEIGTREESVVAAGAEHEPAGVRAPVVERLRVVGVGAFHWTRV